MHGWRWAWVCAWGLGCAWSLACAQTKSAEADLALALRQANADELARTIDVLAQKGTGRDPFEVVFYRGLLELRRERLEQSLALFSTIPHPSAYYYDARNNMGAIYARQGKLDLAKSVMEEALQAHPGLATLHKNLSNLRAHMANKSYASALQILDPAKADRPTLVMLTGPLAREQNKLAGLAPEKPPLAAPAPAPAPAPASAPVVAASPAAPKAPEASAPAPVKPDNAEWAAAEAAAKTALLAWRAAWEGKDLERYFQAYAKDYSPADGKSRSTWMKDRQDRIASKGSIRIRLDKIEAQALSAQQVRLRFRQHYDSDRFKSSSTKVIEMRWVDQEWRITLERTAEGGGR